MISERIVGPFILHDTMNAWLKTLWVFWGDRLKVQVYSTKPRNLEELEGRMRKVMSSMPQENLVKSVDAVHGRLEKQVANNGTHIEF